MTVWQEKKKLVYVENNDNFPKIRQKAELIVTAKPSGELSFVSGNLTLKATKRSCSTTRSSKSILECSATARGDY